MEAILLTIDAYSMAYYIYLMKDFLQRNHMPSKNPDKTKVVRATFSMPQSCLEQLEKLQIAISKKGRAMNKSEIVRAGLVALQNMSREELKSSLSKVAHIKAGRPTLAEASDEG